MTEEKAYSNDVAAFTFSLNPHFYLPVVKEGFEFYAAPRAGVSFTSVYGNVDDYSSVPEKSYDDSNFKTQFFTGVNLGMELWFGGQLIFLAEAGWNQINFSDVSQTLKLDRDGFENSENNNLTLAIGMKFFLKKQSKNKFNQTYLYQID